MVAGVAASTGSEGVPPVVAGEAVAAETSGNTKPIARPRRNPQDREVVPRRKAVRDCGKASVPASSGTLRQP